MSPAPSDAPGRTGTGPLPQLVATPTGLLEVDEASGELLRGRTTPAVGDPFRTSIGDPSTTERVRVGVGMATVPCRRG